MDTNGQAIWRYNTVTTYSEILISGAAPGVANGPYTDGDAASPALLRLARALQLTVELENKP